MLGHAEPQISYPKIVKVEGNDKKWSWLFFPMSRRIPYNLMHEANFKKTFKSGIMLVKHLCHIGFSTFKSRETVNRAKYVWKKLYFCRM